MATMTNAAIKKINDKLNGTGWKFDFNSLVCNGEKGLFKEVPIPDYEEVVCFELLWYPERTSENGYKAYTGRQIPTMHFNKSLRGVSHGLGYWKSVGEASDRKMFSKLEKLAFEFTDEICMNLWEEYKSKPNLYA